MASTNLTGREVIVRRIVDEAMDIRSYELVAADGEPLPPFGAGSHIDVELPSGHVRQYSLCNDPSESERYLIAVLKEPNSRGGSASLHECIREGDSLRIGSPLNHFALARDARKSLLLAGGIGVTPIICMAERLSAIGSDFEFHYFSRSPERAAFVSRIQNSTYAQQAHFHFDSAGVARKPDMGAMLSEVEDGTHLYVCGPKGFMDFVLDTARQQGWSDEQLHYEYFAGAIEQRATDGGFEVELASSGRRIHVATDQTIVQALAGAGVEIPTSCEQGVCGTCCTRVLKGTPDHRDLYFTPEEHALNNQCLPCCARSLTPLLVLDI